MGSNLAGRFYGSGFIVISAGLSPVQCLGELRPPVTLSQDGGQHPLADARLRLWNNLLAGHGFIGLTWFPVLHSL